MDKNNKLFRQLFLENRSRIHAYIMSLVANHADADDIMQTVSVVLWTNFEQFKPGTNFLAWALRCTHLEILNFRKRQKNSREVIFEQPVFEQMLPILEKDIHQTNPREDALEECLKKLNSRNRDIIKMRYGQNLPPREISKTIGITLLGIYKLLGRIHGKLLECIERVTHSENHIYG